MAHKATATGVASHSDLTHFVSTLLSLGGKEASDAAGHLSRVILQTKSLRVGEAEKIPWTALAVALIAASREGEESPNPSEVALELCFFLCGSPPGSDEYLLDDIVTVGESFAAVGTGERKELEKAAKHRVVDVRDLHEWSARPMVIGGITRVLTELREKIAALRPVPSSSGGFGLNAFSQWEGLGEVTLRRLQDAFTQEPWTHEHFQRSHLEAVLRRLGAPINGSPESSSFAQGLLALLTTGGEPAVAGHGLLTTTWVEATVGIGLLCAGTPKDKVSVLWGLLDKENRGGVPTLALERFWSYLAPTAQRHLVQGFV